MAKLSSKTGKGKNAKSLANLKNSKSKQISLSGKETIAQLKDVLIKNKAFNFGTGNFVDLRDLRNDNKTELLSKIKQFNVDIEEGGKGSAGYFVERGSPISQRRDAAQNAVFKNPLFDKIKPKLSKQDIESINKEFMDILDKKYLGTVSRSEMKEYEKDIDNLLKKYDK